MSGPWKLPGYTAVRDLGSGASGRVVLAERGSVRVAIKYLSGELLAHQEFVRRFRDEARLLAGLRDPNVIRFYEYVETAHGAAIVMELVDGVSLRRLLSSEGPTGPEAALVVLKGSLLGLAAAHVAGVVHRDYKPENVLVDGEGRSKLADFGIAAPAGSGAPAEGTPPYMAPEQWNGAPAGTASDVYAATVVFFECVTGRRPYRGANLTALAAQHLRAPIPVDEVPEELRPLIARGMAKGHAERPASAAEFVTELEAVARAAYGEDWEERGRRRLAALALLFTALFPLAGTHFGDTTLGPVKPLPVRTTILKSKAAIAAGTAVLTVAVIAGGVLIVERAGKRDAPVAAVSPRPDPTPTTPDEIIDTVDPRVRRAGTARIKYSMDGCCNRALRAGGVFSFAGKENTVYLSEINQPNENRKGDPYRRKFWDRARAFARGDEIQVDVGKGWTGYDPDNRAGRPDQVVSVGAYASQVPQVVGLDRMRDLLRRAGRVDREGLVYKGRLTEEKTPTAGVKLKIVTRFRVRLDAEHLPSEYWERAVNSENGTKIGAETVKVTFSDWGDAPSPAPSPR